MGRKERRRRRRERKQIQRALLGLPLLKMHRSADGRSVYLDVTNRLLEGAPEIRRRINEMLLEGL